MATTSLEKVMLGEFARLARLHATPVLDLTGAQSTLASGGVSSLGSSAG